MASAGAAPTTKTCVLLLATTIVVILMVAGTAVHGSQDDGCIRRVGESSTTTPLPGSCICYGKCARDRDGHHGLRDAASQTCFVDCVLRNGCICPGAGAGSRGPLPPATTLDKTVRVTVPRQKVWRSREEKKADEEVLRFVAAVEPAGTVRFDVRVNGARLHTFEGTPEDEVHVKEVPVGYAIGGLLDAIGADGDETVVVSFVPEWGGDRVTVRDVRIVYEPKNKVKSI